MPEVTGYLKLV